MKWMLSQHPGVEEDLAQIHEWIARDNPEAADRVIFAITDGAFEALQENPKLGHMDFIALMRLKARFRAAELSPS